MATGSDVAKLARVSPTTVSRVMNDSGYVAEDVRDRVNRAIAQLNYAPGVSGARQRDNTCRSLTRESNHVLKYNSQYRIPSSKSTRKGRVLLGTGQHSRSGSCGWLVKTLAL